MTKKREKIPAPKIEGNDVWVYISKYVRIKNPTFGLMKVEFEAVEIFDKYGNKRAQIGYFEEGF